MVQWQPFQTADEAWAALVEQQGMSDGDIVDLWRHQLQTADELLRAGADEELVVAGLLHDLGDGRVTEAQHGPWAAHLVRPLLGDRVAWVIAQHADAKRYMCAVDPHYWARLSPLSQQTLLHQGGVMTAEEVEAFRAHRWAEDALLLRRCDDAGKDPRREVPDPDRFRVLLEQVVARRRQ
ncbi:MAG TPA: HD domain-containing protein [Chloroflexota bacterium]|nr:HD domain-containing protein [Chloroflexota bacterium]